jgi:hypothetical protein
LPMPRALLGNNILDAPTDRGVSCPGGAKCAPEGA